MWINTLGQSNFNFFYELDFKEMWRHWWTNFSSQFRSLNRSYVFCHQIKSALEVD